MIKVIKPIALSLIMLSFFTSCATNSLHSPADGNIVTNFQLVTDIPIPRSADFDTDRMLVLADRDLWMGRLVMDFWRSKNDLIVFYQTQMLAFGWTPVMSVTSSVTVLNYTRGDRAASVEISDSWFGLKTVVVVTVAPNTFNNVTSKK